MIRDASPLRYPGGKSCLLELVSHTLRINGATRQEYAEPFAGGGGLALNLLFGGCVSDIYLNDIDSAVWSFWHCVLHRTEEFVDLIRRTPATIEEWHKQKAVLNAPLNCDALSLGFSAFFLNRTNRSGIIKGAGVIGGLSQEGNYKLDCRYNVPELVRRIRRVKKYSDRIHLSNLDAIEFLDLRSRELPGAFFCIDPPYFNKGASLYTSFYNPDDHARLADKVLELDQHWIVTYDDTPEIRKLFRSRRQFCFDIKYSVQTKRVGTELLIASKGLRLPAVVKDRQVKKSKRHAVKISAKK